MPVHFNDVKYKPTDWSINITFCAVLDQMRSGAAKRNVFRQGRKMTQGLHHKREI
tara:strand:+ start:485 stop:649 length:165 start_codon:yes stop_codon:yes gene_type:complete